PPGAPLLEMHFVLCPKIDLRIAHQLDQFFLNARCRSASAWAMSGRGLRSLKPSLRNRRWHWRTPSLTPYCCLTNADNTLPSHTLTDRPTASGEPRSARLISSRAAASSKTGRPRGSPSTKPATPSCSNRCIQYLPV